MARFRVKVTDENGYSVNMSIRKTIGNRAVLTDYQYEQLASIGNVAKVENIGGHALKFRKLKNVFVIYVNGRKRDDIQYYQR